MLTIADMSHTAQRHSSIRPATLVSQLEMKMCSTFFLVYIDYSALYIITIEMAIDVDSYCYCSALCPILHLKNLTTLSDLHY